MGAYEIKSHPAGGYTARLATGEYLLEDGKLARFETIVRARRTACDPGRLAIWLAEPGHGKGKAPSEPRGLKRAAEEEQPDGGE